MIVDRCRDKEEFKEFYRKYANEYIASLDWLLNSEKYVFCFYDDMGMLTGCIYIHADEEKRVCLSGFSKPKNYNIVIKAIKWVSEFMKRDTLYSYTECPSAKLVLLRCGFKKIDNNLFIRSAY